jgi:uncharacterized protein with von Willebrand factor type A (vWA) domain
MLCDAAEPRREERYHVRMADDPRSLLTELRHTLLTHHKALLDSERARYDHDIERVTSSGQMLNLVLHDPFFAWLHELSELIVMIDERLDADEPATPADAARLLAQARTLLTPVESGQGFRGQYFDALQRDPDVVIAHGAVVKVLGGLGS